MKIKYYNRGKSKYHNIKARTSEGLEFDSRKELRRWKELSMLQSLGEIEDLQRQVEFELIPAQYETEIRISDKTGKRLKDKMVLKERRCCYIADFVYKDKGGNTIVEDTKSEATRTPEYIIKRKLMRYLKGINVTEI